MNIHKTVVTYLAESGLLSESNASVSGGCSLFTFDCRSPPSLTTPNALVIHQNTTHRALPTYVAPYVVHTNFILGHFSVSLIAVVTPRPCPLQLSVQISAHFLVC